MLVKNCFLEHEKDNLITDLQSLYYYCFSKKSSCVCIHLFIHIYIYIYIHTHTQ